MAFPNVIGRSAPAVRGGPVICPRAAPERVQTDNGAAGSKRGQADMRYDARMTRDEILTLVERRRAAWEAHDTAALAAMHAPSGVVISPTGGVLEGRDEIARVYRLW